MSDREDQEPVQAYQIGAVSRLTGVSPDTLRVWERRYQVVTPARSDAGTRLYYPEDIGRLALIKQLVDRGDAISRVAGLSLHQLRERVRGADISQMEQAPTRVCRAVVLGGLLVDRLRREGGEHRGVEYVGLFQDRSRFLAEAASMNPDVVVLELPTVHVDQVKGIAALVAESGAARAVLVYRFASRVTLERLQSLRIVPRRAPLDTMELRGWCLAVCTGSTAETGARPETENGIELGQPVAPRRFDEASLARIAASSRILRCECPKHLVDLVSNLAAFEAYCEECEVRDVEDAALHAFFHSAAAKARSLIEAALARVVDAEGIVLED
jgi:MerR family transcriptional regulator, light-induced transcriptional regulator